MIKITLCGTTKHKEGFEYANRVLTTAGYLIYSVGWYSHRDSQALVPTEKQKIGLDLVHLMKILESDMIVVIDQNDSASDKYIGDSTRREIAWAELNDRPIFYYRDIPTLIMHGPFGEKLTIGDHTKWDGEFRTDLKDPSRWMGTTHGHNVE